jgi:RNA 2',3'-cyclic 3'-phosphodiesterase
LIGGGRLFVGVPVPAEPADEVARRLRAAEAVLAGGRPVPRQNWHITLRFLGDAPAALANAIDRGWSEAPLPPAFQARLTGWGTFPRSAAARILWVGVAQGAARLSALALLAEEVARTAGFPPEGRPFRPHLTLLRFRDPTDLRKQLAALPPLDVSVRVDRVVLYRSRLGDGPARHEAVRTYSLPP